MEVLIQDIINTKLAAQIVDVAEGTMRAWRSGGVGPPSFKVRGNVRYRRKDVENWLAEQEAATRRGGQVTPADA